MFKSIWLKMGSGYWFFCLIFSVVIFTSCTQKKEGISHQVNDLVQTSSVIHKDFKRTAIGYGYLKATRKEDIIAYSKGRIEKAWIKDGDKVVKGEKLLTLQGTGSLSEIAYIKSEMESAKAELNRQRKEYQRIKAIEEAGGSYKKEMENVYANYQKALESFNASKWQYDFYINGMVIASPITGYVTSLTKVPGSAVQAGELLVSILDLRKLRAEVEVFSPEADLIKSGQSAIITADKKQLSGKVSFVSTEINRKTGARKVGIEISQEKVGKLLPGDFVKADIIVKIHPSSLAIPEKALLNDGGQKVVMVKVGQTYEKRVIVTGLRDQGYVEVLSGLGEGEEVVTTGAYEMLNREIEKKIKIED